MADLIFGAVLILRNKLWHLRCRGVGFMVTIFMSRCVMVNILYVLKVAELIFVTILTMT